MVFASHLNAIALQPWHYIIMYKLYNTIFLSPTSYSNPHLLAGVGYYKGAQRGAPLDAGYSADGKESGLVGQRSSAAR